MVENIIAFLRQAVQSDELSVLLLSVLPMIEIRGAVPIAIGMEMNVFLAIFLSVLGSTLAVIPNMIFVKPFVNYLKSTKFMKNIAENFEADVNKKSGEINKKSLAKKHQNLAKYVAVTMFVAVPVPFTGAYTGSTVAVFLGLNPIKSLLAVAIGNLISGVIIAVLSLYFKQHLDIIITLLAVLVAFAFVTYAYKFLLKNKVATLPSANLDIMGKLTALSCKLKENANNKSVTAKSRATLLKKVGVKKGGHVLKGKNHKINRKGK